MRGKSAVSGASTNGDNDATVFEGLRPLSPQIETLCTRMLPQPRLGFLLADAANAGKTVMDGGIEQSLDLMGFATDLAGCPVAPPRPRLPVPGIA